MIRQLQEVMEVTKTANTYGALCGAREPLGAYLCRTAPRDIDPGLFERHDDTGRDQLP